MDNTDVSSKQDAAEQDKPELSHQKYVVELVKKARAAANKLATLSTTIKDQALTAMAEGLEAKTDDLLAANEKDLEAFAKVKGSKTMADRLELTPERIKEMADGIRQIVKLPDPLGEAPKMWRRPNGMQVGRIRVPIGVIGIIYESRPNVTADSAALCLKSGNACVLRGGSEAIHSNTAIAAVLSEAAEKAGVPPGAVTFVERTEREVAHALLKQDKYVDLIIPRGGESLMKTVTEQSTIPVIKHDKGVCHIYVDADADPAMAEKISLNAKVQRPSTCNAMETLLVHQQIARTFVPD
ncbi:MAG: glutamate-5-semialdehyde dehydrogenase, partial [Nitrospiraceae bacterium]